MTSVGETVRQITMILNRLLLLIVGYDYAWVSDLCSQACRKKVGDRHTHTDRQTDAADFNIVAPPIGGGNYNYSIYLSN